MVLGPHRVRDDHSRKQRDHAGREQRKYANNIGRELEIFQLG